jgi:hypothetical protein
MENLFKEIRDYEMFLLCCVFEALPNKKLSHIKRQVNIVLFFTLSIYKSLFTYFILLYLIFGYSAIIFFVYLVVF